MLPQAELLTPRSEKSLTPRKIKMRCEIYPLKEVRSFASSHLNRFTEILAAIPGAPSRLCDSSLCACAPVKLLTVTGDTALYLKSGWPFCVFLYGAGR